MTTTEMREYDKKVSKIVDKFEETLHPLGNTDHNNDEMLYELEMDYNAKRFIYVIADRLFNKEIIEAADYLISTETMTPKELEKIYLKGDENDTFWACVVLGIYYCIEEEDFPKDLYDKHKEIL